MFGIFLVIARRVNCLVPWSTSLLSSPLKVQHVTSVENTYFFYMLQSERFLLFTAIIS